jgi:lysophospholipase L1-like esterase
MPNVPHQSETGLLLSGGVDSAVLLGQLLARGWKIQQVNQMRTRVISALFVLFCAFSWTANFVAVAKEPPASAVATAKKSTAPARFESEIAAFEKSDHQNAVPENCILFVGSSSIRLWQTADAFPDLPVINRGFGGSTADDVNHFADRIIFKYKPRLIVFYAGDNDLAAGSSPEKVFDDIETFRKQLRDRLPATRLIYLPIKPSPARWKLWPQMQKVNAKLKAIADKVDNVTYIDTATPILGPDGQPRKDLFRDDGLHLNAKGYELWNKILSPILTASLSGRGRG